MNPELEKFIPQIIAIHKKGIGHRLDWSSMEKNWNGLNNADQRNLKLGMIELNVISDDPPGNQTYTLLKDYDFDLGKYKEKKHQENDKKILIISLLKNNYTITQKFN